MGKLTIVTGQRDCGKTSVLAGSVMRWPPGSVAGCLSLKCMSGDGTTEGYDLLTLSEPRRRIPLCRRLPGGPGWFRSGHFMFNPLAFSAAIDEIAAIYQCPALIIIDEIGAIELAGGGLRPLLTAALAAEAPVAAVVRLDLLLSLKTLAII